MGAWMSGSLRFIVFFIMPWAILMLLGAIFY